MKVRQAASPRTALTLLLRELRIEHTLFALPFAYVGAVFAARGLPTFTQFVWVTFAVLGARAAAMAANRYIDREIDARNPRTARRALANGTLAPGVMVAAAIVGLIVLVISAAELNVLCLELLPIAALGIFAYPYCKRFTWGTHFVLGAIDGFAPLGAYIGVGGRVSAAAIAIFLAVTIWVAGFDIIYALMDREVDVAQNIRSIPARFGEAHGRGLPTILHTAMAAILALAGFIGGVGPIYYVGVLFALALTRYERSLFDRAENLFVLNERVFVSNMIFSIAFLGATCAGFGWRL